MEATLTKIAPTLSPLTRRYCKLINILTTGMNILGWGTSILLFLAVLLLSALFHVSSPACDFIVSFLINPICGFNFRLLKVLVPGSLLAFPLLILFALLAVSDDYGTTGIFLNNLPLKNRRFILGCVSSLVYLTGCALYILLLIGPRLFRHSID